MRIVTHESGYGSIVTHERWHEFHVPDPKSGIPVRTKEVRTWNSRIADEGMIFVEGMKGGSTMKVCSSMKTCASLLIGLPVSGTFHETWHEFHVPGPKSGIPVRTKEV